MIKYRKAVVWTAAILLSFSLGFITNTTDNYFEISKNLDIFGKLYREINTLYVEDTDPTELMRTGIDAMLNSLDPYTNYISEEEVEDFKFMSTGQYGGIGAIIGKREGRVLVLEPYEGYPAQKAGLKAGDEVVKIDDIVLNEEKNISDVRNLLRGDKGTKVTLTVRRAGSDSPQIMTLTRTRVRVDNVPYHGMIDDKVGYISLTGFTQDAGEEVEKATIDLKKKNPGLSGIILDLRNNPGGRLDESVNVANVFVNQNEKIVETRGRMNGSRRSHLARHIPVDTEIPLAVLVNGRSASASEIVSGCIQDLDRGIIVGQRSFGKGLVQNIRPLSYNTQLKVTTAKYYTPSGRCIQAINYAERNEDGSVARIPDSLQNAFKTRNGRVVFDGGGIEPDIEVKKQPEQAVITELLSQGLIFDFATHFAARYTANVTPQGFQITPAIYDEFVSFVRKQDFDYKTKAHEQLEILEKTVEDEAYKEELNTELKAVENKLDQQKSLDLYKYKKEISHLLRTEIVTRYCYRQGEIITALEEDKEVKEAVRILSDPSEYQNILRGKQY